MERVFTLQLTVEEVNEILAALGNMPFAQVYKLIGKIQEQAARQLEDDEAGVIEMPGGPDDDD